MVVYLPSMCEVLSLMPDTANQPTDQQKTNDEKADKHETVGKRRVEESECERADVQSSMEAKDRALPESVQSAGLCTERLINAYL